jgi:dTDP-4-amino-4,6-dideoxygalactose transaminase
MATASAMVSVELPTTVVENPVSDRIPFNRAFTTGRELTYIEAAVEATELGGNGPFSSKSCRWLEERIGSRRALTAHSCTGALEMAAILAGIGPGDEVVMPSFTFSSTANAIALRGGVPVFVDVRADTLNLDESLVEAAITDRTKAIMVVHYAGVACEMDTIAAIARRHGVALVEDAAQGLLSRYKGRPLGGIGDVAALSFHESKNVICGEGGALLVNRDDWVERAEIVQEKGTDRSKFMQGLVDKYTWVEIGSSYALSELNAAFLWAQLEHADEITARRLKIWDAYHERLSELEAGGVLRRPVVPAECEHNGHLYYVLLATSERARVLELLNDAGVNAVFHYVPLHDSVAGRRYGRAVDALPVTVDASARLVRLPLWAGMEDRHVDRVVETLADVVSRVP